MSDANNLAKSLRERLSVNTEERMGKALSDLLENPLITGAIGRAFDAREKASQAQEVAMGALNIPSAADIERLTRRLRAVSHRLEGIEDGVQRLDRALSPSAVESRLSAIEDQLGKLTGKLRTEAARPARAAAAAKTTLGSFCSEPAMGTDVPVRELRSATSHLSRRRPLPVYSSVATQTSIRQKNRLSHPHRVLHTPPLPLRPELAGLLPASSAVACRHRHQRALCCSSSRASQDAFARSAPSPTCSARYGCFGPTSVGLRGRR